jgi:hypothetical protein
MICREGTTQEILPRRLEGAKDFWTSPGEERGPGPEAELNR